MGILEQILEQLVILNGKVVSGGEAPAAPATRTRKGAKDEPAAPPAAPATVPVAVAAPVINREDLGKKLVELAKKDVETAKAILAKFKVGKLADAAESDYAAINAAIDEANKPSAADSLL
jgi:hypothetical protein